jgi:CubicO group peptidase (beta-lactamase class C family)
MRPHFALVIWVGSTAILHADQVDDYVKARMEALKIPGLSLAIVRGGEAERVRGYGLANVENQVPVKPETIFQSGSLGKQFTSAGLMMLVEEKKVGLDDPLLRFFPDAPAAWRNIRVRHLLNHTSGLKDYDEKDIDYRKDYTEDDLLTRVFTLPIEFPPGSQWSYSNTGYLLLGILMHKVTGTFYGDFLKERIFLPLGMSSTRIISEADIVPNRAGGYRLEKGDLKNQEWVAPSLNTTADGALYLSASDLVKWDRALTARTLLQPESFRQVFEPATLSNGSTYPYGFGWALSEQRGHLLLEHDGAWQGFRSAIARYTDDHLTIIVLANLAGAPTDDLAHAIAGIVEPTLALPREAPRAGDPEPGRGALLKGVLKDWAEYRPSPRMAPGLRESSTGTAREIGDRRETAEHLQALQSFEFLGEDDLKGRDYARRGQPIRKVIHYELRTEAAHFFYRFYLTAGGEVADFTWGSL